MRFLNLPIILTALGLLAACQTPVDVEQRAIDGRAQLEAGLAESDLLTVRLQGGLRLVVTNVVLHPEQWCSDRLARRGINRHDDYWIEYDRRGPGPRTACAQYKAVKSVRVGDARLCEGLACIFD